MPRPPRRPKIQRVRYIFRAGEIVIRTLAGTTRHELWIGLDIDGPVNLEFLSRQGYDLIPATGLTEDELQSVGVEWFEPVPVEP